MAHSKTQAETTERSPRPPRHPEDQDDEGSSPHGGCAPVTETRFPASLGMAANGSRSHSNGDSCTPRRPCRHSRATDPARPWAGHPEEHSDEGSGPHCGCAPVTQTRCLASLGMTANGSRSHSNGDSWTPRRPWRHRRVTDPARAWAGHPEERSDEGSGPHCGCPAPPVHGRAPPLPRPRHASDVCRVARRGRATTPDQPLRITSGRKTPPASICRAAKTSSPSGSSYHTPTT